VISILGTKENLLWLSTVFTLGNHNFHDVIVSLTTLGLLKKTDFKFFIRKYQFRNVIIIVTMVTLATKKTNNYGFV